MAVDAFIWFKNANVGSTPEGETTDEFYSKEKAFEIKDFSLASKTRRRSARRPAVPVPARSEFNRFTIKRTTDKSSPLLFKNCCVGAHYGSVFIAMRKAGGDPATAAGSYGFRFDTVFTTKIDWSGPGDEGPEESISFVYGKLGIMFTPAAPGSKPVSAGWDQSEQGRKRLVGR